MSEHEQLIRRLDELGATAVDGTSAPPFDAHALRRPRARRHQRRWLAGIALTAVAAVGAVLWAPWAGHPERVDTVATTTPSDDDFPMLMPEVWPQRATGDITTRDPRPVEGQTLVAQHLLARDGVTSAIAVVADYPVGEGMPDFEDTEAPDTIDGREARWITGRGRTSVELALEPGRSVSVRSTTASREDIAALAAAYDGSQLDFDPAAMPAGWSTQADLADVIGFSDGIPPESWATTYRGYEDEPFAMFVAARRLEDSSAVLEQFAGLGGDRTTRMQVGDKPGATITGLGPGLAGSMVVWVYDERTIAVVASDGADPDEALATAASVRDVAADAWEAFATPPAPDHDLDGFDVSNPAEEVIDSGEAFAHRWMITTSPGTAETGPMTTLYLRDPDGNQRGFGWSGDGNVSGTGTWVEGRFRYIQSHVPRDVTDLAIVLHGKPLDFVLMDPGGNSRIALSIVEARSTPRVAAGDLFASGTFPDGTVWREQPPS